MLRGKGISDKYTLTQKTRALSLMESIEDWLNVADDYRFGFGRSEALVSMLRTPNNTFPVYWLDKKSLDYKSPFPRS